MTVSHNRENRAYGAVTGWQEQVRGTNQSVAGTPTINDLSGNGKGPMAALVGVALATGTYYYFLPTSGAAAVDVVLRTSASTGTGLSSAVTVYPTLADNVTAKGTTVGTFAVFVNGTQQTVSNTTLRGERGVLLKIVVPGASSVTFDQAEYSAA